MKRRQVIRLQVAVLILLTVLVALRGCSKEGRPEGIVVLTDIEPEELVEGAFGLQEVAQVRISATGSRDFVSDTLLAAYGWILDHHTREPVWVMSPPGPVQDSATLVHEDMTLTLPPGFYEVYFSSFGIDLSSRRSRSFFTRFFGNGRHWTSDADDWKLIIEAVGESQQAAIAVSHEEVLKSAPDPFWSTGPTSNQQFKTELVKVTEPLNLLVYSIGEISDRAYDFGWIRSGFPGDTLWQLGPGNAVYVGGAAVNRGTKDTLSLDRGIYQIGYRTDPAHAFGRWRANPPYDPYGWGLRLDLVSPDDSSSIARFDPWQTQTQAVSLAPVGNDEHRIADVQIEEPTPVVIYAMGEIGRSRYDFGTLVAADNDSTVWEMTADESVPAGGHANNRRQVSFKTLQPGKYRLEYITDGSHAFDDWRHGVPDHPERWGVTLFTLDDTPLGDVEVRSTSAPSADAPEPHEIAATGGPNLVNLTRVGNDTSLVQAFTIDQTSDLHVQALGEITLTNRYDYGWIENAESGEVVWQMEHENTQPGGGADRNRMFDGVIKLPPGRYRAYFRTDFSHAYDDFRERERPVDPEAWGISIRRLP